MVHTLHEPFAQEMKVITFIIIYFQDLIYESSYILLHWLYGLSYFFSSLETYDEEDYKFDTFFLPHLDKFQTLYDTFSFGNVRTSAGAVAVGQPAWPLTLEPRV